MEENSFWLGLWVCISAVIIIVVGMALLYNAHENELVMKCIKYGNDPMECKAGVDDYYKNELILHNLTKER